MTRVPGRITGKYGSKTNRFALCFRALSVAGQSGKIDRNAENVRGPSAKLEAGSWKPVAGKPYCEAMTRMWAIMPPS
jgi:hypothetical protein